MGVEDAVGGVLPILGTAAVIGAVDAVHKEAQVAGRAGKRKRKKRVRS